MKSFINWLALFVHLLAVDAATASEHLIPSDSPVTRISAYHQKLYSTFKAGYGVDSTLQALVMPSLANEFVAGIRTSPSGYEAFLITTQHPVRMFEMAEQAQQGDPGAKFYIFPDNMPKSYRENPVKIYRQTIAKNLAFRLCNIWAQELAKTSPTEQDEHRLLLDPTTIIFSIKSADHSHISGKVTEPGEGSRLEALTNLAYSLKRYAVGELGGAELGRQTLNFEREYLKPEQLSKIRCN